MNDRPQTGSKTTDERMFIIKKCGSCPNCVVGSPGFDVLTWLHDDSSMDDFLTCKEVEDSHILDKETIAEFCPLKKVV